MKVTGTRWTKFKLHISPRNIVPAYRKSFGALGHSIIIPYMRPFTPHDDRFTVLVYNPNGSPEGQRITVASTLKEATEYAEAYFAGLYEGEGSIFVGEWHPFHDISDIRLKGEQWPLKVEPERGLPSREAVIKNIFDTHASIRKAVERQKEAQ